MEIKNSFEEIKNNLTKFENEIIIVKNPQNHNQNQIKNQNQLQNRPETPCINFFDEKNKDLASHELNNYFSLFMKKIVQTINSDFLSGKINVIEFMLSKMTNIDIDNIKNIKKLAIKVNHEMDILNQIGQRLTNLLDLRLNGSNIITISNIGTNFMNLISLQVNNCNIKDLSGK
jgi:hypothetical protein